MKEKKKLRSNKMTRNKKSFIFLLILCLGIGFAFLSSQLTITGNTSVSGNKWSVYFNNVQITEGSVDASVVPTTTGTTTTSVNYTVLLDKPGDFYEFTVDAVNAGTINAMIDTITMTNIDSDVAKYLSYTATYLDGTSLVQNDVLKATKTVTYKIRVEYKKDIEATDLDENDINLTLTFGVNYVQAPKTVESKFAKLVSSSALSDSGIDFTKASSASNGRGLYVRTGTEDNDYPIYYYRGNVSNNNAKFAGFCWRIVRTTETGGTKLVYNCTPNANGECTNTTGDATQIETSAFNTDYHSPGYSGYMYGAVYESNSQSINNSYSYGTGFEYVDVDPNVSGDETYILKNPVKDTSQLSTHRYTCLKSTDTCSELAYIYGFQTSYPAPMYYIILTDGKDVDEVLTEMLPESSNITNSTIKTTVDNWFNNTFKTYFTNNSKDYNDYLEDTVWCNDRSYLRDGSSRSFENTGWNPDGGNNQYLHYSAYGRRVAGTPSVNCSSKNDSFTVVESATGNGMLTYPIGLLTADEIILAGIIASNSDSYLNTNRDWWTMSPTSFTNAAFGYSVTSYLNDQTLDANYGVRPSISLKPSVKIADGGDGSSATPYEFVVE